MDILNLTSIITFFRRIHSILLILSHTTALQPPKRRRFWARNLVPSMGKDKHSIALCFCIASTDEICQYKISFQSLQLYLLY
jgi:hypothetical protein